MGKATFIFAALLLTTNLFSQTTNWPTWRGPLSTGAATTGNPPTEWSETKNVKWKVDLPGKGHSTPLVWGDVIYVTAAVETDRKPAQTVKSDGSMMAPASARNIYEFVIIAYNKNNGTQLWRKVLAEEQPADNTHVDGSWASNSSVTDGKNIYVYFGSRGLHCIDMQGNLKWSRDFGQLQMKMSFGEGSSPALYKDRIAVQWDDEVDSKIIVLDANTGKDVWVKKREEVSTWSTPLIVEFNGKAQVITSGTSKIRSYDLATGEVVWETPGMTENPTPSPLYANGIAYLLSGYRGNSIMAIDLSKAQGNIENNGAIIWKLTKNAPYVPSPAYINGKLYYLFGNNGKLSCVDAKTGKIFYEGQDLPGIGSAYPSPTIAGGNIYFIGSTGTGFVVREGENFEIISVNELNDSFSASPVVSGNAVYFRGFTKLYCISQ